MRTFVWVDLWQQECCGEPFETGGRVTWNVQPVTGRNAWVAHMLGEAVRFREEHHDDVTTTLTGTVAAIQTVTSRRELVVRDGMEVWHPVEGGAQLHPTDTSDPSAAQESQNGSEEVGVDGWIVELTGAFTSPDSVGG